MQNLSGKGPKPKYPWRTLEIGETFFVHVADANRHAIRCGAHQAGARLGRKFSVRKADFGTIVKRTA
jgi:hypothetical protein